MLLSVLVLGAGLAQTVSAKSLAIDTTARVAEIDAGKLKGEPTELAWAPDGATLFLQTSERDNRGMITNPRYFVMSVSDGKPQPVKEKPEWESEYWAWKSGRFAPGSKTSGIDIHEDVKQASATSSPMGGTLAKGGSASSTAGSSIEDMTTASSQMQKVHVFTLVLKGETVGEFVNQQFLPGYTFGWSPEPLGLIAYVNASGHLALMDEQAQKQQIDWTKNVLLPAWSADAAKIAFLERTSKNKYDLYVASVRR
jgi:hypothetical protein